jgi:hypothetical protein
VRIERRRLFEGTQSADRIVEIGAAKKKVLRPRRQRERKRQRPGSLHGGADALDGKAEVVNRMRRVGGGVFDRAANETDRGSLPNGFGNILRARAKAVFEIGRHRQIGRLHDDGGVGERVVAAQQAFRVPASERESETRAGRRQRLEAERGEKAG